MTGPMPWVIAIMMCLAIMATAAGLGLAAAAARLQTGDRLTIQILEAEPRRREAEARAALAAVSRAPEVISAVRVPPNEMRRLLEPWLGEGGLDAGIPVPDLIDVELAAAGPGEAGRISAIVARAAPSARVDDHAASLAPLGKLMAALQWLAAGLVLLAVGATAATVALAARAALDTHRGTIEILHLMGATDQQIARLFQRRLALDAAFGGAVGLAAAFLVIWLIGRRMSALGSELVGSAGPEAGTWLLLALLPAGGVLLAMAVARWSLMRAMRHLS